MEREESYQEALKLYECLSCMNICNAKITMCKNIKKQMEQLGDYQDASSYVKKCDQIIKETNVGMKESEYNEAVYDMEQAKTAEAYQRVAKRFEKLGDYKDSIERKEETQKKQKIFYRRINRRRYVGFGIVVVIVLGIIASQIPFGKYCEAKVLKSCGLYKQAGKLYKNLDTYKDSEEKYLECNYLEGNAKSKQGEYSDAMKAYQEATSYKDSNHRLVEMQKKVIANKEVGKKVKIGDEDWILLEKQEDKVLLLRDKSFKNIIYSVDTENVTWDNSSVKEWLNTAFLEEHFTKEECENMVSTMGNLAFLLSKEEVEELQKNPELSIQCKSNQWLRTVVEGTNKVMFLNTNGDIMEEGYSANCDKINVRPVIWYSLK